MLAVIAAHMSKSASWTGPALSPTPSEPLALYLLIFATSLGNSVLDPFLTKGGENQFKPP